ncbi:MAG: hypothetical protein AB7W59_24195 [Acidimicrobiia bacterium]
MSVGHVQRVVEAAGLPTVGVYVAAFGHVPEQMMVSRALITPHPMGRPLGAPGDHERQLALTRLAVGLLSRDDRTIERSPLAYRTHARHTLEGTR